MHSNTAGADDNPISAGDAIAFGFTLTVAVVGAILWGLFWGSIAFFHIQNGRVISAVIVTGLFTVPVVYGVSRHVYKSLPGN